MRRWKRQSLRASSDRGVDSVIWADGQCSQRGDGVEAGGPGAPLRGRETESCGGASARCSGREGSLCFGGVTSRKARLPQVLVLAVILVTLALLQGVPHSQSNQFPGAAALDLDTSHSTSLSHISRQLLETSLNCTPPAIEQFPETYFTQEQRSNGAVILHILVGAYMFIALAIACDDYFVPACEKICELLHLSDDVAGATFMAAGSSAPELATACIGVFITKDDIGLGAVVGSAVFNIMLVISICAMFAGQVVPLKWWPLARDCTFYTISILALVFVIMDELVMWWEAVILLLLYVLYIVLMFFNPKLENYFTKTCSRICCDCCCRDLEQAATSQLIPLKPVDASNGTNYAGLESDGVTHEVSDSDDPHDAHEVDALIPGDELCNESSLDIYDSHTTRCPGVDVKDPDPPWVLAFPEGCCKRTLWIISLPLTVVMFLTVPDCRRERWHRWFVVTFIMSIVWIAAFSYVMVWMITIVGFTFHIPDTIMGLTFIAAGSSVPDAIASLIVVREGLGDMAVSNAVGSNVFDILLCLGLPWFLKTTVVTFNEPVVVYSAGLTYSSITLLSTVLFLLVSMHINGWKLTKGYGVVLLFVYIVFNVLASLYELNIFGYVHPPTCSSAY